MRTLQRLGFPSVPDSFKKWLRHHPHARYSNFHNARAKSDLKNALMKNQKFLCCYCETRVNDDCSHIEHIEPQMGGLSARTLDISNMAVSCIKDPKKFEEQHDPSDIGRMRDSYLHCGHARGTLPVISPYDPRCDRLFVYSFGGEIKPNPKLDSQEEIEIAKMSIENLRLNVPPLVALRRLAMYETVRLLDYGVSASAILREINDRLPPFVSCAKAAVDMWNAKMRGGKK